MKDEYILLYRLSHWASINHTNFNNETGMKYWIIENIINLIGSNFFTEIWRVLYAIYKKIFISMILLKNIVYLKEKHFVKRR